MTERPLHEALWLSCAVKRCCSLRTVLPTGADICRIATQLQVPPESFLRAIPAPESATNAFILDSTRQPLYAALARRSQKARADCIFLMQLGERAARCGLGALRPLSCQAFPAVGAPGMLSVDEDQICTCRTWSLADLDRPHVSALLRQATHEQRQYEAVIASWNALVDDAPANTRFSFGDFCRYVVAASGALFDEAKDERRKTNV